MKLGVVVLNYNNYSDTIECVNCFLKQKDINMNIVIVDNCSSNNSIEVLQNEYGNNPIIKILKNKSNLGYAKGNNVGIRYLLKNQYNMIFISNPDIKLTKNDICLELLNSYYNMPNNNYGVLTPLILNRDGSLDSYVKYKKSFLILRIIKKILQINGFKIKDSKKSSNVNYKETITTLNNYYAVSGSGFVLTPNFFKYYNCLYPETFLYFEEWGTILLLHKANLSSHFVETNTVIHTGGTSTPVSSNSNKIKQKRMKDSSLKILKLIFLSRKYIKKVYY